MKEEMDIDEAVKSGRQRWSTTDLVVMALAITVVVVPLCVCLTYFLHPGYGLSDTDDDSPFEPLPVEPDVRINCIPDRDQSPSEELCSNRGCMWMSPYSEGQPWCFFPEDYGAYHVMVDDNMSWGTRIRLERHAEVPSFFGGAIHTLVIDIEHQTNDRIHFKVRQ